MSVTPPNPLRCLVICRTVCAQESQFLQTFCVGGVTARAVTSSCHAAALVIGACRNQGDDVHEVDPRPASLTVGRLSCRRSLFNSRRSKMPWRSTLVANPACTKCFASVVIADASGSMEKSRCDHASLSVL